MSSSDAVAEAQPVQLRRSRPPCLGPTCQDARRSAGTRRGPRDTRGGMSPGGRRCGRPGRAWTTDGAGGDVLGPRLPLPRRPTAPGGPAPRRLEAAGKGREEPASAGVPAGPGPAGRPHAPPPGGLRCRRSGVRCRVSGVAATVGEPRRRGPGRWSW